MKKNLLVIGIGFLLIGASIFSACTKEGPMGPAGANGTNGTSGTNGTNGKDGVDGGTTCTECHNPATVTAVITQYGLSKHSYGEAGFEEAGNTGCGPCHESEAFKYVCQNNVPSTFTLVGTKYVNDYASVSSAAIGAITCNTCHSSLHTTYGKEDLLPYTTVAPVSSTMWAGTQTFDAPAEGGISNLCIKCHQPRPFTASNGDGNVLNYAGLASNPTGIFYDAAQANTLNLLKPGYRTHTHYGTVGAIYVGKGGVEFTGATAYSNSVHTTIASCQDCHMAAINGKSGGHTFFAAGNFNGCNKAGCHTDMSSTKTTFTAVQADTKKGLDDLAAKLKIGGVDILNRNPDAASNLWVTKTTNKYDGYLNIYDPINNPSGIANNPGGTFQNPGSTSSWTQAQKDINTALPKITLTNAQMGAIINFQLCLREYSLGVHNNNYTKALLQNSIAILP